MNEMTLAFLYLAIFWIVSFGLYFLSNWWLNRPSKTMVRIKLVEWPTVGTGESWHELKQPWSVLTWMWIDKKFWKEIEEFQNLPLDSKPSKWSNNQYVREFNAMHPNRKDYIRQVTMLGNKGLIRLNFWQCKYIYIPAHIKCFFLNSSVWWENFKTKRRAMNTEQAMKALRSGETITNLAVGARQIHWMIINGQLCYRLPWHEPQKKWIEEFGNEGPYGDYFFIVENSE